MVVELVAAIVVIIGVALGVRQHFINVYESKEQKTPKFNLEKIAHHEKGLLAIPTFVLPIGILVLVFIIFQGEGFCVDSFYDIYYNYYFCIEWYNYPLGLSPALAFIYVPIFFFFFRRDFLIHKRQESEKTNSEKLHFAETLIRYKLFDKVLHWYIILLIAVALFVALALINTITTFEEIQIEKLIDEYKIMPEKELRLRAQSDLSLMSTEELRFNIGEELINKGLNELDQLSLEELNNKIKKEISLLSKHELSSLILYELYYDLPDEEYYEKEAKIQSLTIDEMRDIAYDELELMTPLDLYSLGEYFVYYNVNIQAYELTDDELRSREQERIKNIPISQLRRDLISELEVKLDDLRLFSEDPGSSVTKTTDLFYGILLIPGVVVYTTFLYKALLTRRKNFWLRSSLACAEISRELKSKHGVESMNYLVLCLKYYNEYIRKNHNMRINKLQGIISKIVSGSPKSLNELSKEIRDALKEKDGFELVRYLKSIRSDNETEPHLISDSRKVKFKEWAPFIIPTASTIIAAIAFALQAMISND